MKEKYCVLFEIKQNCKIIVFTPSFRIDKKVVIKVKLKKKNVNKILHQ